MAKDPIPHKRHNTKQSYVSNNKALKHMNQEVNEKHIHVLY